MERTCSLAGVEVFQMMGNEKLTLSSAKNEIEPWENVNTLIQTRDGEKMEVDAIDKAGPIHESCPS